MTSRGLQFYGLYLVAVLAVGTLLISALAGVTALRMHWQRTTQVFRSGTPALLRWPPRGNLGRPPRRLLDRRSPLPRRSLAHSATPPGLGAPTAGRR
jgi:hypothetical protein